MSAAESRPRPAYGEYATPEEQRARISLPDATDALSAGETVVATPATAPSVAAAPVSTGAGAASTGDSPSTPVKRRPIDRTITVALLAVGLFVVITSVSGLMNFSEFADVSMKSAGIDGQFTNYEQGRLWGTIGAIVFSTGWMLTAYVSWRMLRRGRLAFWVPIVGGIISYIALTACLMVPLLGDPAIADYLARMSA